jgi:cell division protein FtsA
MAGVRLARVHIVTGSVGSGQNLIKCCNRAGLHVEDVLGSPLAAAEAVLTPEERELGVALVEIGAGTTSTVVYHGGAIRHTAVLPVGGGHVTNDLAAALRTPFADAEKLKQRCGSALALTASPDLTVEVAGIGGRPSHKLSPRALADVVEPRCEEVLALVRSEIERGRRRASHVRGRADRWRLGAARYDGPRGARISHPGAPRSAAPSHRIS